MHTTKKRLDIETAESIIKAMQRLSDYGRRLPISSKIGIVQPLHTKMQRQNVVARELATPTKNETLTT